MQCPTAAKKSCAVLFTDAISSHRRCIFFRTRFANGSPCSYRYISASAKALSYCRHVMTFHNDQHPCIGRCIVIDKE
ncbi:hypothetical protein DPMN_168323 [Dreissena polymorpha]|uniref:Uncharacterized protein n=1 Tax=Dreissena polymorpha TaxID=45954 RepID=A0A9D4IZJ7_DREPO|nr:hypothetical protein DPMN_168323 [Dreissena polymorpha]